MTQSESVQKSYSDFILPGHAATTNFENDAISDEFRDVAFGNLPERISTCDYTNFEDFPQLPNSCVGLSILHFNFRSFHANFDKLENFLTSIPLQSGIIGLSEARIECKPLININLPGCRCIHIDSLSNAGGVAAYISYKLKFEICKHQHQLFISKTLWFKVQKYLYCWHCLSSSIQNQNTKLFR